MKKLTRTGLILPLLFVPIMAFAGNWENWGEGLDNARYAENENHIDVDNVADLDLAWPPFIAAGDISATPTVVANKLYVPDWAGYLYRIDAKTGALEWSTQIPLLTGTPGDLSRTSPAIHGDKLIIGNRAIGGGAKIMALKTKDGSPLWSTSLDPHPAAVITQSPSISGNTIFVGVSSSEELLASFPGYPCCTFRGSVAALDLKNGKLLWQTYMTPSNGGVPGGFSGVAVWGSSPAVDHGRHLVYVATGNNYDVPETLADCLAAAVDPEEKQVCLDTYDDPDNLFDAIVALDMDDGDIAWATKLQDFDAWNIACFSFLPGVDPANCPDPFGPDYDFGQAPMLWEADGQAFVGAGQKSGWFWALDRDTGDVIWSALVGPGGEFGGMQWGSATDGERIYVGISNIIAQQSYQLIDGSFTNGGSWSALDPATGEILWQTADPGCKGNGQPCVSRSSVQAPITVANGVVYGASTAGGLYGMDAETGEILWSYDTGASNVGGPAVANGTVFWGSGYSAFGGPGNRLYAFRP